MRSVFLLLSALRKNSILFNILNTHDHPVRPFLDALAAMPRLLKWAAACHHLQLLLFYVPPPERNPPLPDTSVISLSKHRTYHAFVYEHARENNPRSICFDRYPSEFLPAALGIQGIPPHIPLQAKKKINGFRPESTTAMTMTAIQCKVTMSFDERSTRWRVALDHGGASNIGRKKRQL